MNEMIKICRSIVNSENAICRLNKAVVNLAKCVRKTNTGFVCLGIAGIMMCSVIAIQDKEIEALKKQVSDLAKCKEADADPVAVDVANNTEEQTEQEGA